MALLTSLKNPSVKLLPRLQPQSNTDDFLIILKWGRILFRTTTIVVVVLAVVVVVVVVVVIVVGVVVVVLEILQKMSLPQSSEK